MKITAELVTELLLEENTLKIDCYFGRYIDGDFRYIVAMSTTTENLIFEFTEN